ncbi:MAG TPA: zinc ribbon domain-containing protein [Cellvibrionaceae bacterium]
MPVYDYRCAQHGLFHELATIDDSAKPAACPQCGQAAGRVIMLSPELLAMKSANREAHARNEKSRDAPVFSTPEARLEQQARREHKHGKGCGCGDKPIRKSQVLFTPEGNKIFPSARPWMISH